MWRVIEVKMVVIIFSTSVAWCHLRRGIGFSRYLSDLVCSLRSFQIFSRRNTFSASSSWICHAICEKNEEGNHFMICTLLLVSLSLSFSLSLSHTHTLTHSLTHSLTLSLLLSLAFVPWCIQPTIRNSRSHERARKRSDWSRFILDFFFKLPTKITPGFRISLQYSNTSIRISAGQNSSSSIAKRRKSRKFSTPWISSQSWNQHATFRFFKLFKINVEWKWEWRSIWYGEIQCQKLDSWHCVLAKFLPGKLISAVASLSHAVVAEAEEYQKSAITLMICEGTIKCYFREKNWPWIVCARVIKNIIRGKLRETMRKCKGFSSIMEVLSIIFIWYLTGI